MSVPILSGPPVLPPSTQYSGVCSKVASTRNKRADLNTAASPERLVCSQSFRGNLSGIWELDVVIFISLYPNFLLWGSETRE